MIKCIKPPTEYSLDVYLSIYFKKNNSVQKMTQIEPIWVKAFPILLLLMSSI